MKQLCARIFLLAALAWAARAQVLLDRIAVTVGKDVITEGEILDEIRMTAFMNGERPDFSPQARRTAAERLVDQHLVRHEMDVSGYPEPENSEADKMLAQLKRQRFGDDARYRAALQEYGIAEAQLKAHLLWQLAALRFTNFRFQPGIPAVSQALGRRLEAGSEQRAAREAARPTETASGTSRAAVETRAPRTDESAAPTADGSTGAEGAPSPAAAQQNVDKQLDIWLKQARAQARITYRPEAFR